MKKVLLWLWQLPQNILGWFISRNAGIKVYDDITVHFKFLFRSGVSLGNYIILDNIYLNFEDLINDTVKHEHGHQIQSMYLGPLYLIIIGLPSMLGNIYSRIFHKDSVWYYKQPWEAWADKLGGVVR